MTAKGKIKKFLSTQKISKPLLISSVSLLLISIATFFVLRDYRATLLTAPSEVPSPSLLGKLGEDDNNDAIILPEGGEHDDDHPLPTPSPSMAVFPLIKPIPSGKVGFTVSQTDQSVPTMGRGSIDPYDPDIGGSQVVRIYVRGEQPVTKVTGVLKTDNQVANAASFKLVEGSETDGTWEGVWKVNDSYERRYNLVLSATSSRGTSSIEITLR